MFNVTHQVTYNRRAKVFIAEREDTRIAEETTRIRAEFRLIEAVEPALAGMIDCVERKAGEAAAKRAHKAAKLVLAGAVECAEDGKGWSVASETEEGKRYAVIHRYGQWYCGCLDWENGWRGEKYGAPVVEHNGVMCKHALAAKMWAGLEKRKKKRRELQAHDAPNGSRTNTNDSNDTTFAVKSRTIRNGKQEPDVIEGEFDRKGDAEAYAGELARDIREEWPAQLRRNNGHYKLFRGDSQTFVWAEEV